MKKFSDKTKIILHIIFIIIVCSVFIFEICYGNVLGKKKIAYTKEASLNYITYLRDNGHYTNNYLENDYNYVANLIDYFNIDLNYSYVLDQNIDYRLEYEVVGYLDVYDSDNTSKPIEKKTYQFLDKKVEDGNGQVIKVDLYNQKIFYEEYNNVVQAWKKEVSPNATLKIVFKINWQGHSDYLNKDLSDSYVSSFDIPISEKIITISKPTDVKDTGYISSHKAFSLIYVILMLFSGLILLAGICSLIILITKINSGKSKYEQKIKKLLREFDRAITEAKGHFKIEDNERAIEVSEFMELMDVHDNLHEPIIYYKNSDNRCTFVVRNGSDIYYTVIKRDDYE